MRSWTKVFTGLPRDARRDDDRTALANYWSMAPERLLTELRTSRNGLSQEGVRRRLKQYGPNALHSGSQTTAAMLLLNQFKSPLVLILVVAAIISVIAREWPDAVTVLAVVLGSTTLGFVQEYRASDAIEELRSKLTIKSSVVRDGQSRDVLSQHIVPGDVVLLSAGSLIPAGLRTFPTARLSLDSMVSITPPHMTRRFCGTRRAACAVCATCWSTTSASEPASPDGH